MFKIVFFVIVLFNVALCLSLEERKPGYCRIYGTDIKESENFVPAPIGHCEKLKCRDAATNTMAKLGCAKSVLPKGCSLGEKDLTKPYPKCCRRYICPEPPSIYDDLQR